MTHTEPTAAHSRIENGSFAVEFHLAAGSYTGLDKSSGVTVFKDAWYRTGEGGWTEQPMNCEADDRRGSGEDNFNIRRYLI